uniref:Catalase n=1 Tax=Syphacia muris TaxID=451379 RepID=A0A0N5AJ21_9BILA
MNTVIDPNQHDELVHADRKNNFMNTVIGSSKQEDDNQEAKNFDMVAHYANNFFNNRFVATLSVDLLDTGLRYEPFCADRFEKNTAFVPRRRLMYRRSPYVHGCYEKNNFMNTVIDSTNRNDEHPDTPTLYHERNNFVTVATDLPCQRTHYYRVPDCGHYEKNNFMNTAIDPFKQHDHLLNSAVDGEKINLVNTVNGKLFAII